MINLVHQPDAPSNASLGLLLTQPKALSAGKTMNDAVGTT